jgi:hypothetical protein
MLDEVTADFLGGHPPYQAVLRLPGIGPVLAAVVIAEIADASRFPGPGQLRLGRADAAAPRVRRQGPPRAHHQAGLPGPAAVRSGGDPAPGRRQTAPRAQGLHHRSRGRAARGQRPYLQPVASNACPFQLAGRNLLSSLLNCCFSRAPKMRFEISPPWNRTTAGTDLTPQRSANSGQATISTRPIRSRPAYSSATSARTGSYAVQGAHQSAQKSTR